MKTKAALAIIAATLLLSGVSRAQAPSAAPGPYGVGNPVGLPVSTPPGGSFRPVSKNVRVFGSVYSAESCSYDATRGLIVIPNRGVPQTVQTNNAWVTLMNHDGSIHTARWIGVQPPAQRAALTPPLVLNEPYGSDIVGGTLYLSDRDGGTRADEPSMAVIRRFDMATGAPAGEIRVPDAPWFNDIAIAADGAAYGTVTGSHQLWRIPPGGKGTIMIEGGPLKRPNGVAIDPQGHVVVVNIEDDAVLTFSTEGALLGTERAVQAGNDGLVIMADGTKYVSSVVNGGISRIRRGRPAELIAENIPSGASMCYDAGARQLVVPMNDNNAVAFVKLP